MITVVTAATRFALVDVGVVRTAMGIPDQSEDTALTGFLARASDVIARHCKRVFAKETVAEQFRLDEGRDTLILARYPVVEIVSIVEHGTTLSPADYEIDKGRGFVTRLSGDRAAWWPSCKVVVTYSGGYDLPADTPEALQQACVQLVKAYYMGADRDPMVRSEAVDAISTASYFADRAEHLPPDVLALLKQFRKLK